MQSLWRVACVRIPRFPIGAVWRAGRREAAATPAQDAQLLLPLLASTDARTPSAPPHWDDLPIVLTDPDHRRIQSVSAAAGRAGIRAGMRPPQARALCAGLHELAWDQGVVDAAVTIASAALLAGSPQVTPVAGAPGMWWVGASGFDGVGGEADLARTLLRVARRWHPRPRVAIADSCVAARAATWTGASFTARTDEGSLIQVIPPGRDAAWLAPAPLALVPMDEELRAGLVMLGLRTVGALAALAAEDVERRWGDAGLRAWRLAHGHDPRRPVLARVDSHPAVEVALATPAATTEPILFLVRAALDTLVAQLISQGRAVAAVAITLTLDDARGALPDAPSHTITREARTARPLARVVPLFERCRALLDRWTLEAPVSAVRVAIVTTAPLSGEQGDLLSTSWRDAGAADAALERLRAELGAGSVVRAQAQDTHRPERAGVWRDALEMEASTPAPAQRAMPASTVTQGARRALDPPEAVEVQCEGEAPQVIVWRGQRIAVTRAVGPERLSGDWWDDGYRRDYWRCDSLSGEVTLFLDRSDDAWKLQTWGD